MEISPRSVAKKLFSIVTDGRSADLWSLVVSMTREICRYTGVMIIAR